MFKFDKCAKDPCIHVSRKWNNTKTDSNAGNRTRAFLWTKRMEWICNERIIIFYYQKYQLKNTNCVFKLLLFWTNWSFEDHLDVGALEILADPLIPFLQLFSAEVVLPVANLSFPEEPLHVVVHWIVFAKQWLGAMLAMVSDVEVVIKSQHLEIVTSLF